MQTLSTPLVNTRQGTLSGTTEQGIHIWRGIPFAAPPVGALRWRALSLPRAGRACAMPPLFPLPAGRTLNTAASWAAAIRAVSQKIACT